MVTQMLYLCPLGVLPAPINERFATSIRSSGWGLAYGTAVPIPSFFPCRMVWLGNFMPLVDTPIVILALGGAIVVVAAMFGPETRGIDLNTAGTESARSWARAPAVPAAKGAA